MAIKIKTMDGKKLKHHKLHFLARIDNTGGKLIKFKKQPDYFITEKFTVFCLSITHKKWIATDRMSTYIVEIIDTKNNVKIPDFSVLKKA